MFWHKTPSAPLGSPLARSRGGVFPSPGTREVVELLIDRKAKVLDLGPADEGTLAFLGGRGFEVQVADLEPDAVGEAGNFPGDEVSYDAILGWDLVFRVAAASRVAFAETLVRRLQPGGALFLILPLEPEGATWSYRFRIAGLSELAYRPGRGGLSGPVPSNRTVLRMFPDLLCTGARILRHGAREFVLRRPGGFLA